MIEVFLGSVLLVAYTYVGYPLLIFLWGKLRGRPYFSDIDYAPPVTVIVAVHDEEQVIREKIKNLLASHYPKDQLEVLIASDGSSDRTVVLAHTIDDERLRVLEFSTRAGKIGTVEKAVNEARGEFLVLTDANAFFAPDTIRQLIAPFADRSVGCVCGAKNIQADGARALSADQDEGTYWRYENFIKSSETLSGSCVGADGSVYAVRKALFPNIPKNRLLMDDLFVSLMIVMDGYRCIFVPEARAFEPASSSRGVEFARKARILAGSIGVVRTIPGLLRSSFGWRMVSHKLLRWMTGVFMVLAFVSSSQLTDIPLLALLFAVQILFYGAALVGMVLDRFDRPLPLFTQAYYFTLTVAAQVWGVLVYRRDGRTPHWDNLRSQG